MALQAELFKGDLMLEASLVNGVGPVGPGVLKGRPAGEQAVGKGTLATMDAEMLQAESLYRRGQRVSR